MLLLSDQEVSIIQDRAINGPYKTTGDKFAYSPGAWDASKVLADAMYNNTMLWADLWDCPNVTLGSARPDGNANLQPYTNQIGHYTLNAAFYYLIKGITGYGSVAKAAILAQVRNYNPHFEDYYTLSASSALNMFHFAGVATRFLIAFEYVKDLFNSSEIAEVEAWMERCHTMLRYNAEFYPKTNFPNRLSRDYSVLGNYAASGQLWPTGDRWAYKDAVGTRHNQLYRIHTDYNNQWGLDMLFCGLWAIYKNDATRIDRAKIWFEEYMKYGVFPDGTLGEYVRNNQAVTNNIQLGTMWYSVIALECYIYFAEALRRIGDNSMYAYSTTSGLWGSQGTAKNLALILDTLKSYIEGTTLRYNDEMTVSASSLLDVMGGTNWRYKPEIAFGVANLYFDAQKYKDVYLQDNATHDYISIYGPSYITGAQWQNNAGIMQAVPLTYWEMEGVFIPPHTDPSTAINKKMIMSC